MTQNAWNHIVGTWDGSQMRLFINGVETADSPTAKTGTLDESGQDLTIGGMAGTTTRRFRGRIDDARIYDRALNSSEILSLYNSAK